MTEAPFLTAPEVRQEVERIFRRRHRDMLVALYGRGEVSDFDLGGQRWRVVPTRCELELRELLPRPEEHRTEGSVFLVDWVTDVLPLDVACRLAGGRLYHVARDARLAALFGARQVEPGLAGSGLAKLFLSGAVPPPRKVQGILLTRAAAWASLLDSRLRLPELALSSPGALLGWSIGNEGGPGFLVQADADDLWRKVRRELHEWLGASLGDVAVVIWQAWEQGLATRLLEVLPLLAAARRTGDAFLAGQLVGQLSAWLPNLANAVRAVETDLIDEKFLVAALPTERRRLLSILDRSQLLAGGARLEALAANSALLPGGHQARERDLAAATRAFLDRPRRELSASVVEALTRVEEHTLDAHLRHEDHRAARKSFARLVLWLAGRDSTPLSGSRWQPAVDLARRYAEEGGYLEWARQQLRGLRGADEMLLSAARNLDLATTAALRDDHQAFAEAYVGWVDAGKPSGAAVPIEDLGKDVILPFLEGGDKRKLLVVLMDGMSQATAIQVLTRLASSRRWGPIAWRREGWYGVLPLPPVLAVAPTLTEISRGAFFAGKADARFGDAGTDQDSVRWKSNRVNLKVNGEDAPPLFVRRDILSGHDLAADVRDAIRGDRRAVAVIVNAVDEDLKGSLQVAKDYSLAPVLALEALLSAAEEGERVVLLVADHGHVLGDGTQTLEGRLGRGRPGGARWRALADGEAPEPEEIVLPETAWTPRGWKRVAVLWDPSVVNRSANYGEHGGLSLAEAVAPAILIAPDWLERALPDDPAVAVRALPTPDWWDLRVRRPVIRVAAVPEPVRNASPVQTSLFPAQTSLFPVATSARPSPPPAPAPPALLEALRRSSVFQSQIAGQPVAEIERVLSWLTALVDAGDSMPASDFATAAGVRAHQVGGVVARMGILNADGFAMVEHDHVGRRVILHRSRLVQHYGVKE